MDELRKVGLGYLGLTPEEYGRMSLRDLDLKYKGWQELRELDKFDSWERTRVLALYSLTQPGFKAPSRFDLKNPYAKQKKGKRFTKKQLEKRLKRLNELNYKEYVG